MKRSSKQKETVDLLYRLFRSDTQHSPQANMLSEEAHCENLIALAKDELVLPSLHSRLRDIDFLDNLSTEIKTVLRTAEQLNLERNRAILEETRAVVSLLRKLDIEPVLLKGAAYCATGVYSNLGVRYLEDVDLLVPSHQIATAVAVLRENRFHENGADKFGRFRHHYPALQRSGAVSFELHHSLGIGGTCRGLLDASEVIGASVPIEWEGFEIRVPSPEHLVTHLIIHSQLHHPYRERIWPPLRAMYDLVLIRQRFADTLDWTRIERRFRLAGRSGILLMHLLQVRDELGLQLPFDIKPSLLTKIRNLRRSLLRRFPFVRFLDPIYLYSTAVTPRLRLSQNVLAVRGGWKYILKELSAPGIYGRFLADLLQGPGR